MKTTLLLFSLLAATALSGCTVVGLAAGAGAAVGVASEREGGLSSSAQDVKIRALINDKWFKYNLETFAKLNLTVDQGRVLITGIVQSPDARVEAVRLAWQVNGVTQVINEIKIADSESWTDQAHDTWITTRLRTVMTFDRDIHALNYSIDTVDGTVYLMGVALNQEELDHVMDTARGIPRVKQVISYVKLIGVPAKGAGAPTSGDIHGVPGAYDTTPQGTPAYRTQPLPAYAQPDYNSLPEGYSGAPPVRNNSAGNPWYGTTNSDASGNAGYNTSPPANSSYQDNSSYAAPAPVESHSLQPLPVQAEPLH